MNKTFPLMLLAAACLSACGGGGGGGTTLPQPTATPIPVANTSLSYYLPLASGNDWIFATGAKMQDMGSGTLTCGGCPGEGATMEQIALYPPNSTTISSSFFYTKNPPITNIVGVESDSGTNNIQIASNATYPDGVPIMDDSPTVNESWNDGAGDASTIISVGGTLMLPNGTQVIDIAQDELTGNFSPITWSFAKGVGFTQIGVGSSSTSITSFFVNTTTSHSVSRQSKGDRLFRAIGIRPNFASAVGRIFY